MTRSLTDTAARSIALRLLGSVEGGALLLREPDGREHRFGVTGSPLHAEIELHDRGVWRQLLRGSLGIGESYAAGRWSSPDLVSLVALGARNMRGFDRLRDQLRPLLLPVQRLTRGARNTVGRSRRQIAQHYDLSNELFGLFLDPTMSYSCGIFATPDTSLEAAQIEKIDRLCRKLELRPGVRLLEIGSGWGALAIHAASEYGAQVTTTTISNQQALLARERIEAAGLGDRIDLRQQDYRELEGRYDRLVSVEMIEAVGWRDLPTFFRRCDELLADDGLFALQAIQIDDDAYEAEKRGRSFINSLIFPGGCLPSAAVIADCVAGDTRLSAVDHEDLTADYAETLRRWRTAFASATDEVRALGYDERFVRLWDLYLAYCEAGFQERRITLTQNLYAGSSAPRRPSGRPAFRARARRASPQAPSPHAAPAR